MNKKLRLAIYAKNLNSISNLLGKYHQVEAHVEDTAEGFRKAARDAHVIYTSRRYERNMVMNSPNLKWLHIGGAGIDRLLPLSDFDPEVVITHTPSLNANMMANFAICVIFMLLWDFPRLIRNQTDHVWERWPVDHVEGKTIGLIGLGKIGREIAIRCKSYGMNVLGVKRHPSPIPCVDQIVGPNQIHDLLGGADFVITAIPLTNKTRGLLGRKEFAAMKRTAFFVNISRGAIIQEEALIWALNNNQIAGAALDVFATEPLPQSSELWNLKNLIISPHISSWSQDYQQRADGVFLANLDRYLTSKPLLHVVDKKEEY